MADDGYDDIAAATTADGMVLSLQEIKNENVDLVRLLLLFFTYIFYAFV
jgi:hypothetical protein